MIPTIDEIVTGLLDGRYSPEQATVWLRRHAETGEQDHRDWLAGQAMQAIISGKIADGIDYPHYDNVAGYSYAYADAMLAARATGQEDGQ